MNDLLQEREAVVARAIALLQEEGAGGAQSASYPNIDLRLLDGLTISTATKEPTPSTETYRFALTGDAAPTLQVDVLAKSAGVVKHRRVIWSPARAYWYSRSVVDLDAREIQFDIVAFVGEHIIRATNAGVSSCRVPPGTLPLSALATMIAAMPELPREMESSHSTKYPAASCLLRTSRAVRRRSGRRSVSALREWTSSTTTCGLEIAFAKRRFSPPRRISGSRE
jgi:hypothetical protein